jgi:hypothetical protein
MQIPEPLSCMKLRPSDTAAGRESQVRLATRESRLASLCRETKNSKLFPVQHLGMHGLRARARHTVAEAQLIMLPNQGDRCAGWRRRRPRQPKHHMLAHATKQQKQSDTAMSRVIHPATVQALSWSQVYNRFN